MILSMRKIFAIIIFLFLHSYAYADIYRHILEDGTIMITNTPFNKKDTILIKEGVKPEEDPNPKNKRLSKELYYELAEKKAEKHKIDHHLIKAIIEAESNWNPYAVSKKGAMGLMQLMPSTATFLGVKNPFDPEENIDGGIRYLKYLLERFGGNLTLALAAYNAGPALVERVKGIPPISETINYVRRVINYYSQNNRTNNIGFIETTENQKVAKKIEDRIKKFVLDDGTILFTNSSVLNISVFE